MSRYWSKNHVPYGRCDKCGWVGHDWSFKYQGLCSKCYKKWKQEKRKALRKLKPPNDNLEISKGLFVTRNVQNRLLKQSQIDVNPIKHYELMEWVGIVIPLIGVIILFLLDSYPRLLTIIPILIAISIIITVRKKKKINERMEMVKTHAEELAQERKTRIEEAKSFYSSAEWRLIRIKVIKQQGTICQECGHIIKYPFDITVDHIMPRSIYPEESLRLDNLRVLCRSCNAKKGNNNNW